MTSPAQPIEGADRDELLRLVREAEPGPVFVLTLGSTVGDVANVLDALAIGARENDRRRDYRRCFHALLRPSPGRPAFEEDGPLVHEARDLMSDGLTGWEAARAVARRHAPEKARSMARRLVGKLPAKTGR